MRLFFILIALTSLAYSKDPLDHKTGPVLGIGAAGSRYIFPVQYQGSEKDKLDDRTTLLGGALQVGYDVVLKQRLLLGIRGEGFLVDTLGMGNKNGNILKGKTRAANALVRAGIIFDTQFSDVVGDPSHMIVEVFGEAGITSGHRSFSKTFEAANGDRYNDNLEQNFSGEVMGGGLNLTSRSGAFLEVKGSYTTLNKSHQVFTGSKTEGGVTSSLNRNLDDKKGFTVFSLLVGHHY